MKEKITAKKVVGIIVTIVLYAFFAVCLCALIFCLAAKRNSDSDAMNIFGKQMRIVVSGSMEKCDQTDVSGFKIKDIPVKSMIFIDLVPEDEEEAKAWYDKLQVGDVLTFRYVFSGSQETVTHRITEITPNAGGYNISLQGDNKNSTDNVGTQYIDTSRADSPNYVIGKVTGQSKALGWILYNLKQPVGLVLIIIVPCAIIIIMQVVRIANVLSSDKKKKAAEEQEKKDDEIEELKRQLSELQQTQGAEKALPPPHEQSRAERGANTERSDNDKAD